MKNQLKYDELSETSRRHTVTKTTEYGVKPKKVATEKAIAKPKTKPSALINGAM